MPEEESATLLYMARNHHIASLRRGLPPGAGEAGILMASPAQRRTPFPPQIPAGNHRGKRGLAGEIHGGNDYGLKTQFAMEETCPYIWSAIYAEIRL